MDTPAIIQKQKRERMFFPKIRNSGVDRVVDARNKITAAIEAAKEKLLAAIPERFAAEVALRDAEASNALGEPVDIEAARRRVTATAAAIEQRSTVLSGLRYRLAALAGETEVQYQAVKAALPDHAERVKSDFAAEWAKGAAAWSALLGRRAAVEALLGSALTLPEPQPSACELPAEVSAPWKACEELSAGLSEIAGLGNWADMLAVDRMIPRGHRPYDRTAIYSITGPAAGLEPGTLVVDGVFPVGMLEHLHNLGDAELATLQAWQGGLEAGQRAAQRISAEKQREQQARADRCEAAKVTPYDPVKAAAASREQQQPVTDLDPHVGAPGKEWKREAPRKVVGGA